MPTLSDLKGRHSVRSFSPEPLSPKHIRSLEAAVTDVNTHGTGLYFQLITDSPDPFRQVTKSYGMFRNARNYVACVADTSYADYIERTGYFGMQVLMTAYSLGLGTCFVSGSFSPKAVEARVRPGQQLICLIVIGNKAEDEKPTFMASLLHKVSHRHSGLTPMDFLDTRFSSDKICDAFPKLLQGLEAVSYAPSAMNKQPVGILIKKADDPYNPLEPEKKKNKKKFAHEQDLNSRYSQLLHNDSTAEGKTDASLYTCKGFILQAYVPAKNTNQLLDLGIAMYSFQIGCPGDWEWGNPATFIPFD